MNDYAVLYFDTPEDFESIFGTDVYYAILDDLGPVERDNEDDFLTLMPDEDVASIMSACLKEINNSGEFFTVDQEVVSEYEILIPFCYT